MFTPFIKLVINVLTLWSVFVPNACVSKKIGLNNWYARTYDIYEYKSLCFMSNDVFDTFGQNVNLSDEQLPPVFLSLTTLSKKHLAEVGTRRKWIVIPIIIHFSNLTNYLKRYIKPNNNGEYHVSISFYFTCM